MELPGHLRSSPVCVPSPATHARTLCEPLTYVVPCFLRNGTALDPITGTLPDDPQDWFNLVYGMKGVVPDSTYQKLTDLKWWGMTTPKQFLGTLGTLLVS